MADVEVVEEQTTWDPRGILTTRYLLENGDEVLHRVTENVSQVVYSHADYSPKDMRQQRMEEEQRLAKRADIRPMIAQKVLEYEQKLTDEYEAEQRQAKEQ